MSSTSPNPNTEAKQKPQPRKSGLSTTVVVAAVVVFLVVAAAVAVPVGIIYGKTSSPSNSDLRVSFTAAGDVSDFTDAHKTTVLNTLSTAAGFAAVPAGATLDVTSASVRFVATFPDLDPSELALAKAKLADKMADQASAQALLEVGLAAIVVESAPMVQSL